MNFPLKHIPERTMGLRDFGLTMMMNKGLSIKESEHFIESGAPCTYLMKFGFGTALITRDLKEKVKLCQSAGLKPCFGGTLFELFYVRGEFDAYRRFLSEFIKLVGPSANLGNIAPAEVIALEALRCGMRGETFFDVLPEAFHIPENNKF